MRLFLLLCCCVCLAAEVAVDMHVDQAEVAVGDTLRVQLRYRWPSGWEPDPAPQPSRAFDAAGCFITDLPEAKQIDDGQEVLLLQELSLLATRSGGWALPRPGLQVQDPQGAMHTASAPEVLVQVGAGDASSPRLSEPAPAWTRADNDVVQEPRRWPWLFLLLLPLGYWLLLRRRGEGQSLNPAERFAQDMRLVRSGVDGKHTSSLLSQALRRYVGSIYGFDGLGATAREMRSLAKASLDTQARSELLRTLDGLEAQRWAGGQLPVEAVSQWIEAADAWVQAHEQMRAEAESAA